MSGTFQLWCDGSAAPNPGPLGLGVVVIAPDGTEHTGSVLWPERGDNNVAEALAVAEAVRRAVALGASEVVVHSDSDVVVQLLRHAREPTHVPALAAAIAEAEAALAGVTSSFVLVTRRRNSRADALARSALGLSPKVPKAPKR
jgi:ribonuclease HI